MTPIEFLRTVWPDDGFYCVAIKLEHGGYWHTVHDTIAQAAEFVERQKGRDVYFCIHSLREQQVWDKRKKNRETGELGAWATRTKANMREAKAFFLDLDVGQGSGKYASIGEAVDELMRFCNETLLPQPMIVKSGGGVHVYWLLEDSIQTHQWAVYAERLRALCEAHDFMVDPARVSDVASILRVAGTFNYKTGTARPVQVALEGAVTPTDEFIYMLTRACEDAGVKAEAAKAPTTMPNHLRGYTGGNLDKIEKVHKPADLVTMLRRCAQARYLWEGGGQFEYAIWRCGLSIFACTEDGEQNCLDWSMAAGDWFDETSFQTTFAGVGGAYHCDTIASLCGAERCEGCPFKGQVKSPYGAAVAIESAPAPSVQIAVDEGTTVTIEVPNPPYPYTRKPGGGIIRTSKGDKDDPVDEVIYDNDIFPISYIINEEQEQQQYQWRVVFQGDKHRDFTLGSEVLYDRSKFTQELPNKGVMVDFSKVIKMQAFMIAYVRQLQREAEAETQHTHLGWTKGYEQFVLADKILCSDGSVRPAHLTRNAARTCSRVGRSGTLEKQVDLLKFYAKKEYLPNQFMILAGLASPILYMTGHHGAIVNASGEAGSSKSTTLYTAASLWGEPDRYPINGTNNGATINSRNNYVTVLSNLPVCVDEITHIPPKDAANMAMNITQANGRERLGPDGVQRVQPDSMKSTIMLTTANSSLHALLSLDNAAGTAGSMRVVELFFPKALKENKDAADRYFAELTMNYGHIGPAFMHYVTQHQAEVKVRVMETMRHIDALCGIAPSERFWSATAAAIIVAGQIANELGLLYFNMMLLKNWIVDTLLPYMRGVVASQYTTPLGVLTEFLEQINSQILVTSPTTGDRDLGDNVIRDVMGMLSARYDVKLGTMWVMKKAFKDYCIKIGANHLQVLNDLSRHIPGSDQPIIPTTEIRKVLGARTRHSKAQTPCFTVNMQHPEITGLFAKTPVAEKPVVRDYVEPSRAAPQAPPEPVKKAARDPSSRSPSLGPFRRDGA